MCELADSTDVYTVKWLKNKLKEKYGEHTFLPKLKTALMLCFKDLASCLVNEKWYTERKTNTADKSKRIIKTAAKIILNDIRSQNYETDYYPMTATIENIEEGENYVPETLKQFLSILVKKQLSRVSLGQAIISNARPRSSILSIPFASGVELENQFGSRWLLCELNRLGLCISPDEVTRFKQSVIQNENIDKVAIPNPDSFIQYVADNTDLDICTLDGKNTHHWLGTIAIATTKSQVNDPACNRMSIAREKLKHVNEVIKDKGIPIEQYIPARISALSALKLKPVKDLRLTLENKNGSSLDLLWDSAYFFHNH